MATPKNADDGSVRTAISNCSSSTAQTSKIIDHGRGDQIIAQQLSDSSSYQLLDGRQSAIAPFEQEVISSDFINHLEHPEKKKQSSNVTAFVTLLKALFGVSLLSSPRVLGETGLVLGTIVYSLIVVACVGSCWCLLKAREKVASSVIIATAPSSIAQSGSMASTRPTLLTAFSTQTQDSSRTVHAITYGDLGRKLLGAKQSTLINMLIVSLHICFGAGLVATAMHQIAVVLNWEEDYDSYGNDSSYTSDSENNDNDDESEEQQVGAGGRALLASIFFPIISILLQFRDIKDLFRVCLGGLVVFVVGCIGTMLYSTTLVDNDGDGNVIWDVPADAFVWKWGGIPNFVASTLCAMEGINLALPIANHYMTIVPSNNNGITDDSVDRSPVPVVTAAISVFGVSTLLVAYFGYLSGLGGDSSTKNEEDDDDQAGCAYGAHCFDSDLLENIHRISLALALILTLPIILYPSLELLERWAEERNRQLQSGMTSSNRSLDGKSWTGFTWGPRPDSLRRKYDFEEALFGKEPIFPFLHRHWRYRISHAAAVCLLAIVDRQWERGLVLYKGIGLSIACFLLPVILFVKAYTLPVVLQQPGLAAALSGLMALGLVNFVLVILSVFTVHNFLPTEIHDDPMHHHHSADRF